MKMNIKSLAALAMAAALCLALAACSGGETPQPDTPVSEPESAPVSEPESAPVSEPAMDAAKFTAVLDGIKAYEPGTAGASLKAVIAAAGLMDWAEDCEFTPGEVSAAMAEYAASFTDEEAVAFIENVKEVAAAAQTLLTSESAASLFEDAGSPQTHSEYTDAKVGVAIDALTAAAAALEK